MPADRRLDIAVAEVSGVVVEDKGRLTVHNDSGNPALLYTLLREDKGKRWSLGRPDSLGIQQVDWEGVTRTAPDTICVCDIGDNRRQRTSLQFDFVAPDGFVRRQRASYVGGPHNAEACFHESGKLYVLTKAPTGSRGQRPAILHRVAKDRLVPLDTLWLNRRSVTDAYVAMDGLLHLVAYDFGFWVGLPYTRTSVFRVELTRTSKGDIRGFKVNTLRERKVRAPFTLTQYEAIGPAPVGDWILSEKTVWLPARIRRIEF